MENGGQLVKRLDLEEYLSKLETLFSRPKGFHLIGDLEKNYRYLQALERKEFTPPPPVDPLDRELLHLKRFGTLSHSQIFQFVKIVRYFNYLKGRGWEEFADWFDSIQIPAEIEQITRHYDKNGEVVGFEELEGFKAQLSQLEEQIRRELYKYINSRKLESYLVDRQIHLVNGEETLLLRGGFSAVLKGEIVGRSSAGFFYVVPASLQKLKERRNKILEQREEFLYRLARSFSEKLQKWVRFLEFINREFDKFDQLQARLFLAKSEGLQFFKPSRSSRFILRDFCHPALHSCKPVNLEWEKRVLIVTGVNAGGKTMLLKSILSAAFMAKHLLPMKAREGTQIPLFRKIVPIVDDPQNLKQDISTFAGRIREFSQLFKEERGLIGVDEIELGTDANEAAALFKVVVEELMKKNRLVITTHHKRLASLLAHHREVELMAALFDEKRQLPTYQFIKGTIGKSYAFETALRYGIPYSVVTRARKEYGEDLERLELLIERSTQLEWEQKKRLEELEQLRNRLERERLELEELKARQERKFEEEVGKLREQFNRAIEEAKKAIKAKEERERFRHLNRAHQLKRQIELPDRKRPEVEQIKEGSWVQYLNSVGEVVELKGKRAVVEIDGKRFKVPLSALKPAKPPREGGGVVISKPKPSKVDIKLDLHGMRLEEALEEVDRFLNSAVLAGLDEVIIFHGVGKGILAKGVTQLLKEHPLVKEFYTAPPNMGGMGAKIVKL